MIRLAGIGWIAGQRHGWTTRATNPSDFRWPDAKAHPQECAFVVSVDGLQVALALRLQKPMTSNSSEITPNAISVMLGT